MMKKGRDVKAGQMIARGPNGELEPVPEFMPPDVVICRRVMDYPAQQPPPGAALSRCANCGAPIAFNPKKYPEKPHICFQCADIQPLPMES